MTYMLEKDGDKYEIRYSELLKREFPNYEVFWARFIVPLTERVNGGGISLRKGIDPLLENIAMAHYSVCYHLGVAVELRTKLGQEFSEDVLFHLSSATEMVERLIFILTKLKAKLYGTELPVQLTDETVSEMSLQYLSSKDYSKDFERFIKRGQAVNVRLHNIDDVTKLFMKPISEAADKDFDKWQDIAGQIRHYRNTLAHNPKLGMLVTVNETAYFPKESELYKYELWSEVEKRLSNKDFILLSDLLSGIQANLIEKTNGLWVYLIAFIDEVSKTDGYTRLTGAGGKIIILDDSQSGQPIYPRHSGSSSYDPTQSSID